MMMPMVVMMMMMMMLNMITYDNDCDVDHVVDDDYNE